MVHVSWKMYKGNAGRDRGRGRFCLLRVSQPSPGEGIVERGDYWGSRGHNGSVWGKGGRSDTPIGL
jgi:hypothetical protein